MFWLIPAICGLIAIVCAVAGIAPALRAQRAVRAHAERLQAALPVAVVDGERLRSAFDRLDESASSGRMQIARIAGAVAGIADGVRDLRLREAMLALRVAGAALRALRGLF